MTKLELEIHDDVVTTLNKVRSINDSGIEVIIPEGSVLFENILNLKLIRRRLDKLGMTIHFATQDDVGNTLIEMLEDGKASVLEEGTLPPIKEKRRTGPKLALRLPTVKFASKKAFLLLLVLALAVATYLLLGRSLKAIVKIVVNSQPLTRSVTIKVVNDAQTDTAKNILRGGSLATSLEDSLELPTTGTKVVGDKAKGSATIYNNTDTDKELKKGTVLLSGELRYLTLADVTVPKRTLLEEDPENPGLASYQKGEITVTVEAENIGEDYNIDSGKELKVKDFDKSEFNAKVKDDIKGGSSETVKVVAAEDLTTASARLLEDLTAKTKLALKNKVDKKQTLVSGSEKVTLDKEAFNHEAGDEEKTLTATQTVSAVGLVYLKSDLDSLLDNMVSGLIPEGFTLSDKERNTDIEVLGNSTNSVLSDQEADLQVTLKTYVVPSIKEEDVIKGLAGKSPQEAQRFLGSIKNIESYDFRITPGISLLQRVPRNRDRIEVTIERR